jgi:hypothetical protein
MEANREAIERALGYPFATPSRSYLLRDGRPEELDLEDVVEGERIGLLAYGSNAAPEVLAAKLGEAAAPVPVVLAELAGFDVVYSAHVAAYGSVPATLHPSEATTAPVFVAHVTPEQLERIAVTEPNYELRQIGALRVFISRHGPLDFDQGPSALSAVKSRGRTLPERSQREAIERARAILRPDLDLESFILEWVAGGIPTRPLNGPEAA